MAKKSSKKNTRPQGAVDKQQLRQQRLEARRAAKAEAEERRRKQARRERLVRFMILSFVALSLFWFIFLRNQTPSEINGHPISQFSNAGVNDHTNDPQQYETTPPVSGPHAAGTLPCGLYGSQIPDETQVHMLEHGAVGLQYQPTLDPAEISKLEAIAKGEDENVFAAPYQGMETPISVTSWSRKMELDEVDEAAIEEFIDVFAGKGPESGQTCPNEQDQPFQPQQSPSPGEAISPAPGESPEGNGDEEEGDGGGG